MFTEKKKITEKFIKWLLFSAPIVVMVYCFNSGISGNDFWWHIKIGQRITESGVVPVKDIFSWYGMEKGISWTAHEWLADVIFYHMYEIAGAVGMFLFSLGTAILLYVMLWKCAEKYIESNLLFVGLFFALFGVLTSLFFYGRPHIFSYFLVFVELKLLYGFYEDNTRKGIWLIPLLAVLWSNLHGGSSGLAYILCLLFLAAGVLPVKLGRIEAVRLEKKALLKLSGVTVATVLGILVNPIGIRVLLYPYVNLSDKLSMNFISEWQAPDAKLIGNLILYFLPILLMTIGIISEDRKVRLVDLLVMLAFLFLFFRSARFIILWYIAASFYAFRYMPEIKVKPITKLYEKIAVYSLAVLLVLPLFVSVLNIHNVHKEGGLISRAAGEEVIQVIKEDNPRRLYNDYNLGETLIYNDIPVFFDSRADLYAQENIMADGLSLMYLEQANTSAGISYVDVEALVDKYQFDAVVILKVRALYAYMISHPERFELVYEDERLGYFRLIRPDFPITIK